jgi:hypothetical protein
MTAVPSRPPGFPLHHRENNANTLHSNSVLKVSSFFLPCLNTLMFTMASNSALNIKFTGCNPNGWGNKAAMQPITLDLQSETTTRLDDLKEILLNGFKVHRNYQPNYQIEFMIRFPTKPLDTLGKNVVGDLPF